MQQTRRHREAANETVLEQQQQQQQAALGLRMTREFAHASAPPRRIPLPASSVTLASGFP
jgi:hypothetical protein